jgi:hypothetical protein
MIFLYVTLLFVLFVKAFGVDVRQSLPDAKKSGIMAETQKLVNEWPLEVIKHQEKDKKVFLLII